MSKKNIGLPFYAAVQLQDETRNFLSFGNGASYIRDLTGTWNNNETVNPTELDATTWTSWNYVNPKGKAVNPTELDATNWNYVNPKGKTVNPTELDATSRN